ncbi:hypothetical protein SEUBUCD646_0C01480 [Saccharomyces eubayanus]|uniref:PPM-type phosphatase domain-containing protein n=1 Tax=Saccharomyces eubayanus TaxID=1080349 RepID=A0ABN8VLM1_SACEU|nr:hypothetical protein SEUBUCD650_0C01430 [Saccharomyces eubayanus]CAI1915223.1 hypothetical protein SEUBUCD646_0C01480 [Saccharomyces eubayanus]
MIKQGSGNSSSNRRLPSVIWVSQQGESMRLGNAYAYCKPSQKVRLKLDLLRGLPGYVGHATSRISRLDNQDSYSIKMMRSWPNVYGSALNCSVFDGHGEKGAQLSKLLADRLCSNLDRREPHWSKQDLKGLVQEYARRFPEGNYWKQKLTMFDRFYDKFIKNCNSKQELLLMEEGDTAALAQNGGRMIFDKMGNIIDKIALLTEQDRLRLFYGYAQFDLDQCCQLGTAAGSTASSVFLYPYDVPNTPTDEGKEDDSWMISHSGLLKLIVTQVGDSKIILCDQDGIAHPLTTTHHASSSRERRRLSLDPSRLDPDAFGETRFLNNFANTRSFGDVAGKPFGISSEPDIFSFLIGNTLRLPRSERSKLPFNGDECFLALVTDGITNQLADQELVDLITSTVNSWGLKKATPQFVAEETIKFIQAIASKHSDNATCVVVRLSNWGNWPNVDRTGLQRETKLMNAQSNETKLN